MNVIVTCFKPYTGLVLMTDVLKAYYLMSSVQRKDWGGMGEKENAVKVKQDCFLLKDLSPFQNNIGTFRVKDHTGS